MSDLKPCPFCGGKAQRMGHAGGIEFFCGNHDCIVQPCNHSTNERDALSAWNTRAVPEVPELVRYRLNSLGELVYSENGQYVLHSQAAEIIRSMIPRVNNCGRYIAERNDGTLLYLNHGNTWQGRDNFISAKDKEIERLKLGHTDEMNDFILMGMARDEFKNRAEAAESKLAQYEAQEPVGCASVYIYKGRKNIDLNELGNDAAGELPIGDHKLYASPAPAADLKAENDKLRAAAKRYLDASKEHFHESDYVADGELTEADAELFVLVTMEASNDKG